MVLCQCCDLSKATKVLKFNGEKLCLDCYNSAVDMLERNGVPQ